MCTYIFLQMLLFWHSDFDPFWVTFGEGVLHPSVHEVVRPHLLRTLPIPVSTPDSLVEGQLAAALGVYFWRQFYLVDLSVYPDASSTLPRLLEL